QMLDGKGQDADASGIAIDLDIVAGTGAAGAHLDGDGATTNSNGVAAFGPSIDTSERGYELEATASGILDSGASSAFDINDVAKRCSTSDPCLGSSDKGTTTANVSVGSSNGILTLSLGLDDLDCNNAANHFYQSTSSPLTWAITSGSGRVTITIRLDSADVNRPFNLYDVCFASPDSTFVNRYNNRIAKGQA